MAPKKKLTKKEKARLEAEQAELLRIELEKERQKKLEEERQRKQIELEQAKRRQQQEIKENKQRRMLLKASMEFFNAVQRAIDAIKADEKDKRDWEKYMRCNGLPNANSPSDLRRYIHQWLLDVELKNREERNWLLSTDERSVLTHDPNVPDLTRETLRQMQGNLGDSYARRIQEVLGILSELDEVLAERNHPPHILLDLRRLKMEQRVLLSDYLDEFTYKIMSHIQRDMEIDRPGVSKHIFDSDVFKSHIWTFSKDAQVSPHPKPRIGEQNVHIEIDFPVMKMQLTLPPSVRLQTAALRGLWLHYDHFSDYCPSFTMKRPRPENLNILIQTKHEWRKRKEILQSLLDDCMKDSPHSEDPVEAERFKQRSFDIDKLYTEYEDELNKARRRAIGPEAHGLIDTDVNLRKYRIIGGVYCIDYIDTPEQHKELNTKSFIRTVTSSEKLTHRKFYQSFTPPPPPQPGVRRLPEEIEAEMRMVEAALDKLASVSIELPQSVVWFEPPIVCRWETQVETFESDLLATAKATTTDATAASVTFTPTEATSLSVTTNPSPLKGSPRMPARLRKRSPQKSGFAVISAGPTKVREITDFDMHNIPSNVDIYGLMKDFVVPRLPVGYGARFELTNEEQNKKKKTTTTTTKRNKKPRQRILFLARYTPANPNDMKINVKSARLAVQTRRITEDYLDLNEPREFFPRIEVEKVIKFRDPATDEVKGDRLYLGKKKTKKEVVPVEQWAVEDGEKEGEKSLAEIRRVEPQRPDAPADESEPYMFSQLLEDLDRLCELQMPLQEEALTKISANLTSPPLDDADGAITTEAVERDDEITMADAEPPPPPSEILSPSMHSPYGGSGGGFYTGISFVRDMEAKNDDDKNKTNTDDEDEDDDEESSSDEDNIGNEDAEAFYYNVNESGRVNAGGSDGDADNSIKPGRKSLSGRRADDGIHNFLSKHNQSETDSASDGSKAKNSNALLLTQGKWSTRDVHDVKFNEDKLQMQFRTGRLGVFGFALNRYSNMPYQTWEIRPDFKSPGTVLFNFTASIVSLDMTITSAGYCVTNFQGGSTDALNEMIGKTLSLGELKSTLVSSAVDIFPEEDAFCYTEGSCGKNYVMEMHLYACMSTLAQSHNFSWSRWNLLAGSRTAVLLVREMVEGKKVPNHSTLLVTPLKTAIIECTEVSASFNAAGIAGMEYYPDLYQLSQVHALPVSLAKQRSMEPLLRDNVASILKAIRPLSFC